MMMIILAMMMMLAKGAMQCATLGAGRGMWHSERWHSFLEYHPHHPRYTRYTPTTTNWFSVIDDTKQPYNQPCSQPTKQLLPTNQLSCHLPIQEVDYLDNKLAFSDRKIAIGKGFR